MITCYCDGGCDNMTHSGSYGSYAIIEEDGGLSLTRLEFNVNTSNEAEYATLISLLEFLNIENIEQEIIIYSDSQLVVNQVNGRWRVKAENLKGMCKQARFLFTHLPNVKLEWVGRETMVRILGH